MKRKWIIIGTVLGMAFSGMTVCAAPQTMSDGTVFDAEYYAQNNPDVTAVFGNDADALYRHYVQYGRSEGRAGTADSFSDNFDAEYYAQNNPDVVAVFGNDAALLYQHYVNFGKAEGRKPAATENAGNAYSEKTAVSTVAIASSIHSGQTDCWITTYSDGTMSRLINREYQLNYLKNSYSLDFPDEWFIARTDFSDGLRDADGNGIDDRDPCNACGYTDRDFNCVADEGYASRPGLGAWIVDHICIHGVVGGENLISTDDCFCSECSAFRKEAIAQGRW